METEGVKDELAAMQLGENEDVNMADADATDAGIVMLDKVSLLQESVDKMALSMFNALRLLPAATGDDAKNQETKDAITTLANDVLKMVQETDALIDDLPGLDKTEAEQMEELRRLQIESDEEAQTLRQVAEEAGIKLAVDGSGTGLTSSYLGDTSAPLIFIEYEVPRIPD